MSQSEKPNNKKNEGPINLASKASMLFKYEGLDLRRKGILLLDLGEITPRSEGVGIKPTSLQALFHRINAYSESYFADIATISHDSNHEISINPGGLSDTSESTKQMNDFDIVGISLVNNNQIFDLFKVLDTLNIHPFADERKEEDKLIILGGASTINPMPLAPYADAIVLGQGEDVLLKMTKIINSCKERGVSKSETLEQISEIPGVFVPSVIGERVDFAEIDYKDESYPPGSVYVVDGKASIVISRSCPHSCAFCRLSSSQVYQMKPFDQIKKHVELLKNNGAKEITIVSASSSAYLSEGKRFNDIVSLIEENGIASRHMADRPELIGFGQQKSVVLAPETSPRLRKFILEKTIKEEVLLKAIEEAVKVGVETFTFYSIVGILDYKGKKGENEEDYQYFADLALKVEDLAKKCGKNSPKIEFNIMPLMPSPHTNLENHPMVDWLKFQNIIMKLNSNVSNPENVTFYTHLNEIDFTLEGLLNRSGDSEGRLCYAAYKISKRDEIDYLSALKIAMDERNIDYSLYLKERTTESLPYYGLVSPIRKRKEMRPE